MATHHVSASTEAKDATFAPETLDVASCDREPIHVPGSIQPHGLLLIADAATLRIVGGAGDIADRLNPAWADLPLPVLLGQRIEPAIAQADEVKGVTATLSPVPGRRGAFDGILYRVGDRILVELEPRAEHVSAAAMLARLDALGASFERAHDLAQMCERAAVAFRELTGFDRVMIYQFLDDAAGVVVGEDRAPALGTFLNHHFPASDIPKQARALYVRNRVRVIPDVGYEPAPIRGIDPEVARVDLSDSVLRSVSPIHVRYLKNMGVSASASVSIVKDGLLWGLVACHHNSPRRIPLETRAACRALAGGLARQIRAREEADAYRERIRLRTAEDQIIPRLDQASDFASALRDQADALRCLLEADGFAAVSTREAITAGRCPAPEEVKAIARWLGGRSGGEPFATHVLERRFPEAEAFRDTASGVIAVSLASEVPIMLLWFRAEESQTVEWAGNPHKGDTGPDGVLTPRDSFAAWCEVLRGQARRWTLGEIEAAARIRRALMDSRRARRLRELNRELADMIAQKDTLLIEKDHLLGEVNHRVQNSLQLVQSFLALQSRTEDSEVVKTHLEEAQRRISAVALVHRRLYQADQVATIDLGRYVEELVGEIRASMGGEWREIGLDLAPVLVSADRAINVGLILTELVINAQKYAYAGRPGPISICIEAYRHQFRLIIADHGVGTQREHRGFGTRMMNAMVQRLGGTIERMDNAPGLRVVVSAPVEQD